MSAQIPMDIDWTLLTLFTRLTCLRLKFVNYEAGAVRESMQNMLGLTELQIRFNDIDSHAADDFCALDFISPLTALQSLDLGVWVWAPHRFEPSEPYDFNQMTKLLIRDSLSALKMDCLTRMVDLNVATYRMPSSDLSRVLPRMTLLDSLEITNERWCLTLRSTSLRQLQHLKRLSLMKLAVELDLFQALATLPGLTELHFISRKEKKLDSHEFRLEVNLLTTLRVLKIAVGTTDISPLEYIREGGLLRLRDISFPWFYGWADEKNELRRRLPCLEEISVFGD